MPYTGGNHALRPVHHWERVFIPWGTTIPELMKLLGRNTIPPDAYFETYTQYDSDGPQVVLTWPIYSLAVYRPPVRV